MAGHLCGCSVREHRGVMLEILHAIDYAHLAPERQVIVAILKHNSGLPGCCTSLLANDAWEAALRQNDKCANGADAGGLLDSLVSNGSSRSTSTGGGGASSFVQFSPSSEDRKRDRFELLDNAFARTHPVTYDPFATLHKVTPDDVSAVFAYMVYRNNTFGALAQSVHKFNSGVAKELHWFRYMKMCPVVQLAVDILDSAWTGDVCEWPLARLWQTIQVGVRQQIFWVNETTYSVEPIATRPIVENGQTASLRGVVVSPLLAINPKTPGYNYFFWYWLFGYYYYYCRFDSNLVTGARQNQRRHKKRERSVKYTAALMLRNCTSIPVRHIETSLCSILLGSGPVVRYTQGENLFQPLFGCKNAFEFVRLCGDVVRMDEKQSCSVVFNCEPDSVCLPDSAFSRFHFLCSLYYRASEAVLPRLPF